MSTPDGFKVVLVGQDGSIVLPEGHTTSHHDGFESVFIPAQRADETHVRFIETDLNEVAGREREMGAETIYSAKYEAYDSDKDMSYGIEVEFSEYPRGTLQPYELSEDNMRYVHIDNLEQFIERLTS